MLAYQEGRLSSAETLFLQYVNKRPKYTEAWFKLGNIYYRTGQYPAAITAYENVIQQSPKNGKAWHNLALTRVKQAEMTLMKAESLLEAGDPQKRQVTALKNKIRGGVRQPTPAGALNKYSVPAKQKQQKVKPQNKKKKVVTKKKYTKSTRGSIKNKQINKETPNKNKLSSSSNYWNNIARQLSIK